MPKTVSLKVWGEFALFTRPELKVERMSYSFMTPSAARGVLDAILFKPQMRWNIQRITAIAPMFPAEFPVSARDDHYRLIAIRRNEIQDKISTSNANTWIKSPDKCKPYYVDSAAQANLRSDIVGLRYGLNVSKTPPQIPIAWQVDSKTVERWNHSPSSTRTIL